MRRVPHYFYQFGPFRIDPAKRLLLQAGEVVPLSPKAFELLVTLAENSPRVLEKDELMAELWPGSVVEESNLTQTIYVLRKALGEGTHESHYIETIPRHGYRFMAVVEEVCDEGDVSAKSAAPVIAESTNGQITDDPSSPASDLFRPSILSRTWLRQHILVAGLALLGLVLLGAWLWSAQRTSTLKAALPVHSIAVLPFKPVNPNGSDDYLGLGLADVLITRLSSLQQVIVQPISAVRKYERLEQHPVTAGRELRVEAVLEGAFQKIDNHLRVTARLINVQDGQALWSGRFDEQLTDIFKVQDSISEQVASALALRLSPEKHLLLIKHGMSNTEAYNLYLKGRYHWNKRTAADLKKAIAYFEQAITIPHKVTT
jgi:DNA-binding winged helix-turn-helix (wHTH) protein/TolB-like protein